jgi:hemerythrin
MMTTANAPAFSAHFALEERFMREHGYDQLALHKADHERLLDEIREIMDDIRMIGRSAAPWSSL